MRKFFTIILTIVLFFNFSFANAISIKILPSNVEKVEKTLTREDIFNYFANSVFVGLPESYKYINLKFKGLEKDSELYESFQKLVYLDLVKNTEVIIFKDKFLSSYSFFKIAEKIYNIDLLTGEDKTELKSKLANTSDIETLEKKLSIEKYNLELGNSDKSIYEKKLIFSDVYKTIKTAHYDKENISELDMINSAIEGLANGSNDKFTTYFPPVKNKSFNESLTGEYEGIGSYVDMENPGELKIISPIVGTPAERAGLKGGDIVTHVDDKKIEKENSLQEVVSWIKGPAGTTVKLTIKRNNKSFDVEVERANIIIKDVEYEKLDYSTFYINLKFFGPNTFVDFKKALEELEANKNIKKVILDLRSNPGGYLNQVTHMLSFFVPEGEPTAVVKYRESEVSYKSKGYDIIDFSKYKLVILQNSGSASASEIMIGSIKDYFPETILVGENTYGKGSVQTIKEYTDGSSLKYTIAKWFTGKTQTGIDGVGIAPDIEVIVEDYITDRNNDPQFNKAREIR